MRAAPVFMLFCVGCGPSWADMGGTVQGQAFENPAGVYYGGNTVLIMSKDVGCLNLGWVEDRYVETEPAGTTTSFTAVQISLQDEITTESLGSYSLDSSGGTDTWGLISEGGSFSVDHARSGELTIDDVGSDYAEGTLSLAFAEDGVGGTWHAEYCVGLSLD